MYRQTRQRMIRELSKEVNTSNDAYEESYEDYLETLEDGDLYKEYIGVFGEDELEENR